MNKQEKEFKKLIFRISEKNLQSQLETEKEVLRYALKALKTYIPIIKKVDGSFCTVSILGDVFEFHNTSPIYRCQDFDGYYLVSSERDVIYNLCELGDYFRNKEKTNVTS